MLPPYQTSHFVDLARISSEGTSSTAPACSLPGFTSAKTTSIDMFDQKTLFKITIPTPIYIYSGIKGDQNDWGSEDGYENGRQKPPQRQTNKQMVGAEAYIYLAKLRDLGIERETIAAARVEFGLDEHVGDEVGGLASLVEEAIEVGLRGDVAVLLELLANLRRRFPQHYVVPCK